MLRDCDILVLLGNDDVSDICSEVDELEDDNCFSINEFDNLLDDFDNLYPEIVLDLDVEFDFMNTNKYDFIGLV